LGDRDFRFSFLGLGVPPCWRAYFLLLRQKKVAKEKATSGAAPATPVPCATRKSGRLAKLAYGSDNASRLPPAFLRCLAPSTGTRKASRLGHLVKKTDFHGQPGKRPKIKIPCLIVDASPGPLEGAEQHRGWRKRGEGCLRAKPEFRSHRQSRVAQGTGAAGTDPGSPSSLATFFLAKQEESTPASKAEPQANSEGKSSC
jgi:hypothetical protein